MRWGCALATVAALAWAPPGAFAADTVIGFDDLAASADVTSQYHAQGVDLNLDASGHATTRSVSGARSPSQILDISGCSGEFCSPTAFVRGTFSSLHAHIAVYAGDWYALPESRSVTLTALSATGAVLDTAGPVAVSSGAGFTTLLEITRPAADIAGFEVGTSPGAARVGFDDLTFDAPSSPPPPLPVPPAVTITSPVAGQRFASAPSPLQVTGTVSAPGGIDRFCVAGPGNQPSLPAACDQAASVAPDGSFDTPLTGLGTGPNFVSAWVRDRSGQVAHHELVIQVGSGARLSVNGIDVTQGIQTIDMAQRDRPDDNAPISYSGVELAAGARTIVRVYASALPEAGKPSVKGVAALLYGCRGTALLPGGPLSPERGLRDLPFSFPAVAFTTERISPGNAYTFTLPASWTASGNLRLKAQVFDATGGFFGAAPPPQATCATDGGPDPSTLELKGVPFVPTRGFSIHPVAMSYAKELGFPDPAAVFDRIRSITPVAEGQARLPLIQGFTEYFPGPPPRWKYLGHETQYEGYVDIGDIKADLDAKSLSAKDANTKVLDRLVEYVNDGGCGYGCGSVVVGVTGGTAYGLTRHTCGDWFSETFDTSCPNDAPTAVVSFARPLTSVAHELYHGLGRVHASAACGGGDGDQVAEPWPPDQVGLIQGVGLDPQPASGAGGAGPYRIIYKPAGDPKGYASKPGGSTPNEWFDFMSYCAAAGLGDFNSWQSVQGWEKTLRLLRTDCRWVFPAIIGGGLPTQVCPGEPGFRTALRTRPRAAAPVVSGLRVQARDADGTVTIGDIAPLTAPPAIAPAGARYHLVAHDAGGVVLADTPMAVDITHIDGGGGLVLLSGQVPAPHAAQVEIVRDGVVVASRTRSAHPPTVRVIAPRRRAVVGVHGTATVRWHASDADRDALTALVDYTRDGGRHYKPVWAGPAATGHVTLPSTLLSHSQRGRVRVRVADGFDEATALSPPFVAVGGPPALRIIAPARGQRIAADAALAAQAEAWSDTPSPIAGRGVRWFEGRRRIATGAHPSITGLRPGRRTLRVVARDGARTTTRKVTIRVTAVRPLFIELHGRRRGRAAAVTVASTVAATLRVGARHFVVGRRARTVRVRLARGASSLSLTLVAAGLKTRARLPS